MAKGRRRQNGNPAPEPGETRDEIARRRALYGTEKPPAEPDEPEPPLGMRRARAGFRNDLSGRGDSRIEQLRVPPQSVEAEQAVLGGIMLTGDRSVETFSLVKAMGLSEHDFYRRDHQLIWRAMESHWSTDTPMDAVTLGDWFESQCLGEHVAGGAYLVELASTTPSAANIRAYAEIVIDKAKLRAIIEAGTTTVNDGFYPEGRDSDEVLQEAFKRLERVDRRIQVAGHGIVSMITETFDDIQRRYDKGTDIPGYETAYPRMTDFIGGFQQDRLYYIGARTKMGKTIMLADNAMYAAVQLQLAVAVWSLELTKKQWGYRMLSAASGIEYKKLERPRLLDQDDWAILVETIRKLREARYTIYDEPGITVERAAAQAAMLKARGEIDIGFFDYLQIAGNKGAERRDLDVGEASRGLKNIALRNTIPMVAAFQINRGNEKGPNVRAPRPSDARESGNIEQDCDVMVLIHRPGYYDKKSRGTRVEVALNRDGETGVFRLEDDLARSRFLHSNFDWHDGQNYDDDGGLM